jgi:hypothetical protein
MKRRSPKPNSACSESWRVNRHQEPKRPPALSIILMPFFIRPSFNVVLHGFTFLGRGPSVTGPPNGWATTKNLYYSAWSVGI